MKRVAVFGNAGGGKSTLARHLSELTRLPLYPLDSIQFKAGGGKVPYGVRAAFVGKSDERSVRVSPTLRKLVIAPLLQVGFRCMGGTSWKQGTFLERRVGNVTQSLLPGTEKFGGAIGMLACREVGGGVAYFDWRQSTLRSGRLNYRTQAELEAVCVRWNEVLREEVVPWLERLP